MTSQLRKFVDLGVDYLLRCVCDDGRFRYVRDIEKTEHDDFRGYNMLRHAGATLALCEQGAKHDARALCALTHLLSKVAPTSSWGDLPCAAIVENGEAKLGGAALTLLALLAADVDNDQGRAVANHICSQMNDDGSFRSLWFDGTTKPRAFDSLYYPGEAILALVRAHRTYGEDMYLSHAYHAAAHLADKYSRLTIAELPADHWLMMGIAELTDDLDAPDLTTCVMRLADSIVQSATLGAIEPEHGTWDEQNRSCPAATRGEGLAAAVRIARRLGNTEAAGRYMTCLWAAISHCIHCQLMPSEAPEWAVGGIRKSPSSPLIRIDYVQHAMSAIAGYHALDCEVAA